MSDAPCEGEGDALAAFVARVAAGHRARPEEVRALLASGCPREALLDALVAAADGASDSRALHRALAVLRDVDRGAGEPVR